MNQEVQKEIDKKLKGKEIFIIASLKSIGKSNFFKDNPNYILIKEKIKK